MTDLQEKQKSEYIDAEIGGIISTLSKLINLNVNNIHYMKASIVDDMLHFECSTIYSMITFQIKANTSYLYLGYSEKNVSSEVANLIVNYINAKQRESLNESNRED